MLNLMVALEKKERLLIFPYCRIGKIRLKLNVNYLTFSLNLMLPLRDKKVAETMTDMEDKFMESKEAGRKRKTIQKSQWQVSRYK